MIPIFLGWGFVEYFYRTVPNNYTLKYKQINQNKSEIEVLIFGSSHALYGLNPKYFTQKTYNLSGISQTIYFDFLLFKEYIHQLPELKTVILCIEHTNLSQVDNSSEDTFRKYYYKAFMDMNVPIIKKYDLTQYFLSVTRPLKFTINQIKKYHETGTIVNIDDNGWGNDYPKSGSNVNIENAILRAQNNEDGLLDFSTNTLRIQYIINLCKEKNINLLIVSMPQTKDYLLQLNQEKLDKIIKTCKNLETQNFHNVKYLNLFKDQRFSDSDFYDADHLNNEGAEKCSVIINEFVNRM